MFGTLGWGVSGFIFEFILPGVHDHAISINKMLQKNLYLYMFPIYHLIVPYSDAIWLNFEHFGNPNPNSHWN